MPSLVRRRPKLQCLVGRSFDILQGAGVVGSGEAGKGAGSVFVHAESSFRNFFR
jgi:hypothetical protein